MKTAPVEGHCDSQSLVGITKMSHVTVKMAPSAGRAAVEKTPMARRATVQMGPLPRGPQWSVVTVSPWCTHGQEVHCRVSAHTLDLHYGNGTLDQGGHGQDGSHGLEGPLQRQHPAKKTTMKTAPVGGHCDSQSLIQMVPITRKATVKITPMAIWATIEVAPMVHPGPGDLSC